MALAILIAAAVFRAWVPDRPLPELTAKWAPPPSKFITLDGMNVHMRDEGPRGDPSPIVLLHGTSASLHTWNGWAEQLIGRRRVVRLDLPGFGLTGPFPNDDYAMSHYVDVLARFLDALEIERCVLVGNSFGGNLAWHMALAQASRVSRLILIDSGGYAHESQTVPIGFRIARVPVLNKVVEYVLPRGAIESSLRSVYGDPTRITPELVDRYYDLTLRAGNRRALVRRFEDIPAGMDEARIREVSTPTLILWGSDDRLAPVEYGERFQRDVPGSRLVVLPGLGHVPHEEDPRASLAAASEFLAPD